MQKVSCRRVPWARDINNYIAQMLWSKLVFFKAEHFIYRLEYQYVHCHRDYENARSNTHTQAPYFVLQCITQPC